MSDHEIISLTEYQLEKRIRTKANKQKLVATKSRRDGMWYFADLNNLLVSPRNGMTANQAYVWLK